MTETPTTPEELLERLERDGIEHLWVTYHDYSGRPCAKTMPRSAFRSTVHEGVVFALANLDMDIDDNQAPDATLLADSGDFLAVPDSRSYAVLPNYPKTARVHAWMRATDGSAWPGCPRTRLQEAVNELWHAGYSAKVAYEPEFYFLTPGAHPGEYLPINHTRMFSEAGLAAENALSVRIIDDLQSMGITVAQLGKEFGHGQYEMSVKYASPLRALDDYYHLRAVIRDAARDHGYLVTFMPKVYPEWVGSSLHLHLSLWDATGDRDLTPGTDDELSLSEVGGWFMGGLLKHAAALTGLGSPTVNSYKRLLPGSWAPANTYWGYGNRSGVIRIPGVGKRRHLEYRSGDNTCQPALFAAGLLAAGLDGIQNQIDPGPPFQGDIGHLTPEQIERYGLGFLPRTLPEALAALEADPVIAAAVGPVALHHFLLVKRHELARYEVQVHPWERLTYLEVS